MLAKRMIPLLAVVLAASAACSSTSSSDTSNTSKSTGDTPPNCPSAADINANLGLSVNEPTVSGSGRYRVCNYKPAGKAGSAIVTFNTNFDATKFAAAKTSAQGAGQNPADLAGVGDEAYSSTIGTATVTTNTVVARKGTFEVLVTSGASIDQEKAYVIKLLG